MRYLVNGHEMKEIDRRTIEEFGIPSLVLMERAALAVAEEAEKILQEKNRSRRSAVSVCAVCGLGNNGADGAAAARMLHLHGYHVSILLPESTGHMTAEMETQLAIAKNLGIPVFTVKDAAEETYDLILDAVFGIGLKRPVEGIFAELIAKVNQQKDAFVISVDMPSGISSETGEVMGCAVEADRTVTFGELKLGHALFPGRAYSGELIVSDIGFVPEEKETAERHVMAHTKEDLTMIPKRMPYSHKGTYGKILVAAGAKNMAGAAYFSAKAAYRTGAGLVKVMTVEENRQIIQEKLPEAILTTYDPEQASQDTKEFKEYIRTQMEWADVIVLGPGIGTEEYSRILVETILEEAYVPIILDADGINLAARYPYLKKYFTENIILTPHVAEFSRISEKSIEEIKENPVEAAREFFEKYGLTCILKDAATVTARKDGKIFVNLSGSPAMAKGGSGDVLCGVIAGFLGLGMDECDAASLGVYVHGLAGEAAAEKYGVHSVLAGELADGIGEVINEKL